MEYRKGNASDIRFCTEVYGGGAANHVSVSTSYVLTFKLNNKPVILHLNEPAFLSEDDDVGIVGFERADGVFSACAYHNLSCGATSSSSGAQFFILGSIFAALGVLVPLVVVLALAHEFRHEPMMLIAIVVGVLLFGGLFAAYGFQALEHGAHERAASLLLKRSQARST